MLNHNFLKKNQDITFKKYLENVKTRLENNPLLFYHRFAFDKHFRTILPIFYEKLLDKTVTDDIYLKWRDVIKTIIKCGYSICTSERTYAKNQTYIKEFKKDNKIFFASACCDIPIIRQLTYENSAILNSTKDGETALIFLMKYGYPETGQKFIDCLKFITTSSNINNKLDYHGQKPKDMLLNDIEFVRKLKTYEISEYVETILCGPENLVGKHY